MGGCCGREEHEERRTNNANTNANRPEPVRRPLSQRGGGHALGMKPVPPPRTMDDNGRPLTGNGPPAKQSSSSNSSNGAPSLRDAATIQSEAAKAEQIRNQRAKTLDTKKLHLQENRPRKTTEAPAPVARKVSRGPRKGPSVHDDDPRREETPDDAYGSSVYHT